jgi:DNA processing protein
MGKEANSDKKACLHRCPNVQYILSMENCIDGGELPPGEIRSMLALALAPHVGPATFHKLMAAFGSAEGVFGAAAAELTAVCPQLKAESLAAILAGPDLKAVRFQEETCQRLKVRLVSDRSAAYPASLLTLHQPPPFLFMAGTWRSEDAKSLAVVGTRYPSSYGTRMAKELSAGMSEAGYTVVSGLARGIDTLAHEAALAAGAHTVAVLGSGLDWIYPPENVNLARRIAKQGCVLSEFPMGVRPNAKHFPRRNRIISALSMGTLVVEAGNDSGALITADYAADQGREVFAVPGAVHQPGSRGTHKLIQEGAHLVERAEDIVRLLQSASQAVPARRFAVAGRAPEGEASEVEAADSGDGVDRAKAIEAAGRENGAAPDAEPISLFPDSGSEALASGTAQVSSAAVVSSAQPGPRFLDRWIPVKLKASPADAPTALDSAPAGLDEEARCLLSLMGREAITLDAIAEKARGKPRFRDAAAHRLLAGLLELELKGRVKRMPGALFRLS